ncbi:LINE-1 type transposase domain-containing protein 1 [Labeo rohita]|uniref:LINE-1 type transposase domain-containing protein 1 n=1 Tax=Labeo rohita TaxID=84645 RepID=A0ABQ8L7N3_LABRO|nr:LINE-1 type transposase domain-containing protein 1 [Labeo rohita]
MDVSVDMHTLSAVTDPGFVKDVKVKVDHLTSRLQLGEQRNETYETRLADLERYSRRWNLRLRGVPEKEDEWMKGLSHPHM